MISKIQYLGIENNNKINNNKSNPTFTSLPTKQVMELGKDTFDKAVKADTPDNFFKEITRYCKDLSSLLKKPEGASREERVLAGKFKDELFNELYTPLLLHSNPEFRPSLQKMNPKIINDSGFIEFQKDKLSNTLKLIDKTAIQWSKLESWNNPQVSVPANDVINEIRNTILNNNLDYNINSPIMDSFRGLVKANNNHGSILFKNTDLLEQNEVKNPFKFYDMFSRFINVTAKESEGHVEVKISKDIKNGKQQFFATFTNPETSILPDEDITKILKYTGSQKESSAVDSSVNSGIKGFGMDLIKLVQQNGLEQGFVIEKGRTQGVSFTIPLSLS